MKVALDAGHGARGKLSHTGASANGLVEDDVALDMVARIGHHLRSLGHQTYITRPTGEMVALSTRGRGAVKQDCDLFLSIHCNAGAASANGVEAFVVRGDARGFRAADTLVNAVKEHGMKSRGVKFDSQSQHSSLRVLRDTYRHMPAVLIEIGFLTNTHDAKLLSDRRWREDVVVALVENMIR